MHALELIGRALTDDDPDYPVLPRGEETGVCCITGVKTETYSRNLLLGKSFTNLDILLAPDSDRVGIYAYIAMKYKWQRMSCWHVATDFVRLDKPKIRNLVFGRLPEKPWAGYVTTGYKKHGGLNATVNSGKSNIWLFEMLTVDCTDQEKVRMIWDNLNIYLRKGIGRNSMESLYMPVYAVNKIGLSNWMSFEEWAKPIYKSPLYLFMVYLLPSQKELKEEDNNGG